MPISEALHTVVLVAVVMLLLKVLDVGTTITAFGVNFSPFVFVVLGLALIYALLEVVEGILLKVKTFVNIAK